MTDKKRREIAVSLREMHKDLSTRGLSVWTEYKNWCEMIGPYALAGLIDPQPNKTCRFDVVKNEAVYFVLKCSLCGFEHTENKTDAGVETFDPNYCPNCGAKVVDDEE